MIDSADFAALNAGLAAAFRPGRSRCFACKRKLTDQRCPSVPWPRAFVPGFFTVDFVRACDAQCAGIARRDIASRVARDAQLNPRERMHSVLENVAEALAGRDDAEAAE